MRSDPGHTPARSGAIEARRARGILDEIATRRGDRPLAVFLDFDGTLSTIVRDPADATLSTGMRAAVQAVAARWPVAIVSGRDREDVAARVGVPGLVYAGNHGLDIAGRGFAMTATGAEDRTGDVDRAERELRGRVGNLSGVIIERKRFSVAIHYRQVDDPGVVERVAAEAGRLAVATGLRLRSGKKVFELEPPVDWNKGRAVEWLRDVLPGVADAHAFVVYLGDDVTDEDAFAVLADDGVGIRVGDEVTPSQADYQLADQDEVRDLLAALAAAPGRDG